MLGVICTGGHSVVLYWNSSPPAPFGGVASYTFTTAEAGTATAIAADAVTIQDRSLLERIRSTSRALAIVDRDASRAASGAP